MIRTQIFLTKDEVRLLEMESKQRNIPKSEMIREAVDEYLGIKGVTKESMLKAFEKSLGSCKGTDLKNRVRKARNYW